VQRPLEQAECQLIDTCIGLRRFHATNTLK
jgi:hypothetical protein